MYQFLVDILDLDEKSHESYLRHVNEAETYNFVMSQRQGRGFGSGVHKEYTFIDDSEVVIETLERDFRLEDAEYEEDLIKSAVNAQINNVLREVDRRTVTSEINFISHTGGIPNFDSTDFSK